MPLLKKTLVKQPVLYVTRDLERGLGLSPNTPGYSIMTNRSAFANALAASRTDIFFASGKALLDTRELLQNEVLSAHIKENPAAVLVFKNTPEIERICMERGYRLLNPSAALANRIEEKLSQIEWLGPLSTHLPPFEIHPCKEVNWKNEPFVLQFNRAHTGSGTHLISSSEELKRLQQTFPDRPAKMTPYIDGPAFTVNAVVTDKDVLVGNISYQITGLTPFTALPFATVGNDWSLAARLLSAEQKKEIEEMARAVGMRMQKDGWRGLFGIDVMLETKTGEIFLIEINARQPASARYESTLQTAEHPNGVSIFEAHLLTLLGEPVSGPLARIANGAQIIQRVTGEETATHADRWKQKLESKGFRVIPYDNTKPEADLLRIESDCSIMQAHEQLNEQGIIIQDILTQEHDTAAAPADSRTAMPSRREIKTLSPEALKTKQAYQELVLGGASIPCPYFNNKRVGIRGGLRAHIGKGTPQEIVEEARILARKKHMNLSTCSKDDLQRFLVDHHLGVDCSGFAYHLLDAEVRAQTKKPLKTFITFPFIKNPIRKWIVRFRSAEQTNVKTFAHEQNSMPTALREVRPGDMIIILSKKGAGSPDHMLVIHTVEYVDGAPVRLQYAHSFQWKTDGPYHHGVREGSIDIQDSNAPLLDQTWKESGKTEPDNETWQAAMHARVLSLRRLRSLS